MADSLAIDIENGTLIEGTLINDGVTYMGGVPFLSHRTIAADTLEYCDSFYNSLLAGHSTINMLKRKGYYSWQIK